MSPSEIIASLRGEDAINALLVFAVVVSAVTDLRSRRILNVVTVPTLVCGVALNALFYGTAGLKLSLAGFGFALLVLSPLVWTGGVHMGDFKLLLAIAALKRWPFIALAMMYTAVAGGALAIFALARHRRFGRLFDRLGQLARSPKKFVEETEESADERDYVPYGVAIAAGTLYALLTL